MKLLFIVLIGFFTYPPAIVAQTKTAAAQPKPEVLSNTSIITMTKAGLGNPIIVSKIESSTCKFDLSTNGLIDLKKQGVADEVVQSMMNKGNNKPSTPSASTTTSNSSTTSGTKTDPAKPAVSGGATNIDLVNHVYTYNKTTQGVKPLEKAVAGTRTKQGFFGGSVLLQVDGAKSSMRLSLDEATSFVINTSGPAAPELVLYHLKSIKDHREVPSMKVGSFTGVKTGEDVISIDIIKLKEGIYQITPGKKLDKGEYFFTGKPTAGSNSMDAYAFGVD